MCSSESCQRCGFGTGDGKMANLSPPGGGGWGVGGGAGLPPDIRTLILHKGEEKEGDDKKNDKRS